MRDITLRLHVYGLTFISGRGGELGEMTDWGGVSNRQNQKSQIMISF